MNNRHIIQLENRLEQLVEGAFVNLFGKRIGAHDIALRLARAMAEKCIVAQGSDPRLIAPDEYSIFVSPQVHKALLEKHSNLASILSRHIIELATQTGYRMNTPMVKILSDHKLDNSDLIVTANHRDKLEHSTAAMQRIVLPPVQHPVNAQLVIENSHIVMLDKDIINIGRSSDNDIVLDDPYISRHHIQLRLRSGACLLFEAETQAGTYVNEVRVKEHELKSGDVIRIGKTQMIYIQDELDADNDPTEAFDPIL